MTDSSILDANPPDPVRSTDLLTEFGGNISGRTTPSSFRESTLGWGMSLLCGGMGYSAVEPREALINYYNEGTINLQKSIIATLEGTDKEARLGLLASSMFHACARNFIENNGKRFTAASALTIYGSIEEFNDQNTLKDTTKKYKISSVQYQLAGRNSQQVADNILNVCGALGMPYEAMQVLLNRPDLVYKGFSSTMGDPITNRGTSRGYALWVLYAAARQSYQHATSYVVDDMFYVDVHSNNSLDEDIGKILEEVGVFSEMDPKLEGYKLIKMESQLYFVPDMEYVESRFKELAREAAEGHFEDNPQELNANLLQLAYLLNPFPEEFSAVLGLLRQSSSFVPDISCVSGCVPTSEKDLIDYHDLSSSTMARIKQELEGSFTIKPLVMLLHTNLRRAYRHHARHGRNKSWHIEGNKLSNDQKAQAKTKLYDLLLSVNANDWGTVDDTGWGSPPN